jgi:hypothetical protein
VTAPSGVEVSFTQASGFAPNLQVAAFPAFPPTTIYARIKDNASVAPITGVISHTSPGAPNNDVAVSGNVVSLVASVPTLNAGLTTIGIPGNPVSYDLTGDGLISATSVTVPLGFEIASNGGLISHAALVARELALPAVVGVSGATTAIPDGAKVEVDPATGQVRIS